MKRSLYLGLVFVAVAGLVSSDVNASGSVSPGGKLTPRGAYTLGKAITFREVVCRTCPINRREFNRTRARALIDTLSAAFKTSKPGEPEDDVIVALCSSSAESCVVNIELVHYYLKRRYRL